MEMKLEEQLVDMEEEKGDEKPRELFLAELNLVLILSFFSLSSEERKLEELEIDNDKDYQAHNFISKLKSKKRGGINKYRATDQHEFPRFQTKIKDCRHCRRM
ncbi:uncharacterized protein LOC132054856 [Lycium ferocissimum]|uniref:uncharacterized protein LOC132054856 n=1 Tax=Lycium ferocissimum TaxID=112874 RepID=UPI002814B717|nr:uncharacterized protein LOC132054856 [Lycium ferocissimum]